MEFMIGNAREKYVITK